jgi:DNA-binding transcriptional ArsR family regulator
MTIRFHLPSHATEHIAFAYSPLLEAVLSLHVLVEPKHHPVQHAFVRHARFLSSGLKREIAAFSFALRAYMPLFLSPRATGPFPSFESELAELADLPLPLVAFEFSRPCYGGSVPRDPRALAHPAVREAILQCAQRLSPASQSLVQLALDDPQVLLDRFRTLMNAYWEECFRDEWIRIEPRLAEAVQEAGQGIAGRGLFELLCELTPEVRVDEEAQLFWLERSHEHEVTLEAEEFVLTPSSFVWPHVRVNCDPPWPYGLVYPAPSVTRAAHPQIPPGELIRLLQALGDDTRLKTLRCLAVRPRSTQELASLVQVSEAAMSKHLRRLADAGLLTSHREGYYVLYELLPTRLPALSPSLASFLLDAVAEEQ